MDRLERKMTNNLLLLNLILSSATLFFILYNTFHKEKHEEKIIAKKEDLSLLQKIVEYITSKNLEPSIELDDSGRYFLAIKVEKNRFANILYSDDYKNISADSKEFDKKYNEATSLIDKFIECEGLKKGENK